MLGRYIVIEVQVYVGGGTQSGMRALCGFANGFRRRSG